MLPGWATRAPGYRPQARGRRPTRTRAAPRPEMARISVFSRRGMFGAAPTLSRGLRVDGVDEGQDFGDYRVEFARQRLTDFELGKGLHEAGVLMDRNVVLARDPDDLLGSQSAADGDDLRRLRADRIVRQRSRRRPFRRV